MVIHQKFRSRALHALLSRSFSTEETRLKTPLEPSVGGEARIVRSVKHAGEHALQEISEFLAELRRVPGLTEKKNGIFYRGSRAFFHVHEDPAGLFADVRIGDEFERFRISSKKEQAVVLARIRECC